MDFSEIWIPESALKAWQYILDNAAIKCVVPAALIMKVDPPEIEVFLTSKSKGNPYAVGNSELLLESGLYCERVVKTKASLLVPNALKNKEWDKNPDIKLGMISYLGFPILWPNGGVFGTVCILDSKENPYKEVHGKILMLFKQYIEDYLDWRVTMYLQSDSKEIMTKGLRCDKSFSKIEKLFRI